ncbi:hypothetical protein ACQP1P_27820 [Dactylosporangium sp. CA-052675]|uniref:hypothetical protein n=1 Tax=Dactylosporangium sp. CA-052675 TaxID=3239927 RepID=UPI003D91A2D0
MIVTTSPRTAEVSCDRCGATLRLAGADRETVWARAHALGWQAERLRDLWWHRCPTCAGRFVEGPPTL